VRSSHPSRSCRSGRTCSPRTSTSAACSGTAGPAHRSSLLPPAEPASRTCRPCPRPGRLPSGRRQASSGCAGTFRPMSLISRFRRDVTMSVRFSRAVRIADSRSIGSGDVRRGAVDRVDRHAPDRVAGSAHDEALEHEFGRPLVGFRGHHDDWRVAASAWAETMSSGASVRSPPSPCCPRPASGPGPARSFADSTAWIV